MDNTNDNIASGNVRPETALAADASDEAESRQSTEPGTSQTADDREPLVRMLHEAELGIPRSRQILNPSTTHEADVVDLCVVGSEDDIRNRHLEQVRRDSQAAFEDRLCNPPVPRELQLANSVSWRRLGDRFASAAIHLFFGLCIVGVLILGIAIQQWNKIELPDLVKPLAMAAISVLVSLAFLQFRRALNFLALGRASR